MVKTEIFVELMLVPVGAVVNVYVVALDGSEKSI